jgi:hypothetical protein
MNLINCKKQEISFETYNRIDSLVVWFRITWRVLSLSLSLKYRSVRNQNVGSLESYYWNDSLVINIHFDSLICFRQKLVNSTKTNIWFDFNWFECWVPRVRLNIFIDENSFNNIQFPINEFVILNESLSNSLRNFINLDESILKLNLCCRITV